MAMSIGAVAGRCCAKGEAHARRRRRRLVLVAVGALLALGGAQASVASAGIDQELAVFSDCPLANPEVSICAYSTVEGGEFKLGSKDVPINKTIVLQGGLRPGSNQLVPAADGETLSHTPLTVPGGLTGIEGLGGEVTATAELAGPVTLDTTNLLQGGPSVILPLKVKLEHPVLGSNCYIGSDSEPVTLTLTTGTTSPPAPTEPISGKTGKLSFAGAGSIVRVTGTVLVENAFAVPGVTGCGLVPLVFDPLVDVAAGLPAEAGKNVAVQDVTFEEAFPEKLAHQAILPAIGRCVKVARGTGEYEDSKCVSGGEGEGKYDWLSGPGSAPKFTSSGSKTTLEGVSGAKVECKKSTGAGEYTGAKSLSDAVTLTGCQLAFSKASCQSSGAAAGEIKTGALTGALGFITDHSGPSDELIVSVGVDLSSGSPLIQAECGGLSEGLEVTGSVIGSIGKLDAMSKTLTLTDTQNAGKQAPEAFEEGTKDTLSATLGAGAEQTGLASKQTIRNEEKLEVKAAQQ
jgi:hypothetical protein